MFVMLAVAPAARAEVIVAVTEDPVINDTVPQNLIAVDSANPGVLVSRPGTNSATAIPLQLSDDALLTQQVLAIDYRPADGKLYAVIQSNPVGGGNTSNTLSTINTVTGEVVPVDTSPTEGTIGTPFQPPGSELDPDLGIDFNPVVDLLRVVTEGDENMRVDPDTGLLVGGVQDTNLAYQGGVPADADVVAAAYTNNRAGASATQLFAVDSANDRYAQQTNPNGGVLVSLATPFQATDDDKGYDISAAGRGFIANNVGANTFLVNVDPTTGALGASLPFGAPGVVYPSISAVPAGQFAIDDVTVVENGGNAQLTVRRAAGSTDTVQVTLTATPGSATAGGDYTPPPGAPLTFAEGETEKAISIPLTDDAANEPTETFTLTLSNPTRGAGLDDATATVQIIDDDPAPPPPEDLPPSVEITTPAQGALVPVSGTTVEATSSDDNAVASVAIYVGTRLLCTDSSAPHSCALTPSAAEVGPVTLSAIATDSAGQIAATLRQITIDRFAPQGLTLAVDLRPASSGARGVSLIASGELQLPGAAKPQGCAGKVELNLVSDPDQIRITKHRVVKLQSDCSFRRSVKMRPRDIRRSGKVVVSAAFLGNEFASGVEAAQVSVRLPAGGPRAAGSR